MHINPAILVIALAVCFPALSACARTAAGPGAAGAAMAQDAAPVIEEAQEAALPLLTVHKAEYCGCCGSWVEHMRKAGFPVEVHNVENLNTIKERVGVPLGKGSCHTAEVAGYFIEGHIPADDVKRLLAEKPDAKGLVVPGMPSGSPGMEVPGGAVERYDVELVQPDGSITVFAQHGDQ